MLALTSSPFPIKREPFKWLKNVIEFWGQKTSTFKLCLVMLFFTTFCFLGRTFFIFTILDDFDQFVAYTMTYPIPFMAVIKMYFLLLKRQEVSFLLDVENFWDLEVGVSKTALYLTKRQKVLSVFMFCYTSMALCYVVLHLISGDVPIPEGRTRWLPLLLTLPFDQDKSPNYEFVYVLSVFNMAMSIFGNAFFDYLFFYGCQHLIAQFIILTDLVKNIDFGLVQNENFLSEIKRRLTLCVDHHAILLKYGYRLKEFGSIIFGLQVLTTFMCLVLIGFTMSESREGFTKSSRLLTVVISTTIQLVILILQSSELTEKSISLANAAYLSKWYLFDWRIKKGLVLLIQNSQKGLRIMAADLIVMTNSLIFEVGHKAFSFITLLKTIHE